MPKVIKKRVTKKTGLQEKSVKGTLQHTVSMVKEKQRILIYVLSAIGLIIVSVIAFMIYVSSTREKAYSFEMEAYKYYYNSNITSPVTGEERWKKALELFQKSIDIKPTPAAQFYAGNCYFNLGDYDNAVKAYNTFIYNYGSEEIIRPLVFQKLASAYFKKGNLDEAIKALDTLAKLKNGIFKDAALIIEARHYEGIGKIEDAMKTYNEIISGFPASPWASEAKARIKMAEEKKSQAPPQSIAPEAQ